MSKFFDCFQQHFSEKGKILATAERAGCFIGILYGARACVPKTDPLLRLIKEGDSDGIIAYLECELPVFMAEIPEDTYSMEFMEEFYMDFIEGFYDGYHKGKTGEYDASLMGSRHYSISHEVLMGSRFAPVPETSHSISHEVGERDIAIRPALHGGLRIVARNESQNDD